MANALVEVKFVEVVGEKSLRDYVCGDIVMVTRYEGHMKYAYITPKPAIRGWNEMVFIKDGTYAKELSEYYGRPLLPGETVTITGK